MSDIHGIEVHFRSGTEDAKNWLKDGLTRDGFKKLSDSAKASGVIKFADNNGDKFDLKYDSEEERFEVKKHY